MPELNEDLITQGHAAVNNLQQSHASNMSEDIDRNHRQPSPNMEEFKMQVFRPFRSETLTVSGLLSGFLTNVGFSLLAEFATKLRNRSSPSWKRAVSTRAPPGPSGLLDQWRKTVKALPAEALEGLLFFP